MRIRSLGALLWVTLGCVGACDAGEAPPDRSAFATETYALTACPDGDMIDGIDVSKWQGAINWSAVADDGIDFAFIRVSDGLGYQDAYFQSNWSEARAHGITRGVYQFFRSDEDPVAQAQYLLDEMGPLMPGDLPPVCDVETADGQSPATIVDRVQTWLDVVESALGVKPLIYTSPGVWGSIVNSGAFSEYPLWVAHWGVSCPSMPTGWDDWVVWQTSDNGTVSGINGPVDTNKFNGGLDALAALTFGGVIDEPVVPPEETATPCPVSPVANTLLEEDGPCARRIGPVYTKHYTDIGGHGGHAWALVADEPSPDFTEGVEWLFDVVEAGAYKVWAHVPASDLALATSATYEVTHASGSTAVVVDHASSAGSTVLLGVFQFEAGTQGQSVRVLDSFVTPTDEGQILLIDAIEVGPSSYCACFEVDAIETLPCGDGTMTRVCDGCQWSEWSACMTEAPDAGAEDTPSEDTSVDDDDAGGVGPEAGSEDATGHEGSVRAYTSSARVTDHGCSGGAPPLYPVGWLLLACALLVWRRFRRSGEEVEQ